jgi:predicted dehydrogenase
MAVDDPPSDSVAALVVDVPLAKRAAVLERLLARCLRLPILIEAPVVVDPSLAGAMADLARDDSVVVANPLRYALHTRRLLEDVTRERMQTFFAAWRFRSESSHEHALPQLLDYICALCPETPRRISAMQHGEQPIVIVTLRYPSDVLGSIEVGGHLPRSFPTESELVFECFCETSAYVCEPGHQTIEVYGAEHGAHPWQPEPADAIVTAFAGWLRGGARPPGSIADDVANRRLVDRVSRALQTGAVLE